MVLGEFRSQGVKWWLTVPFLGDIQGIHSCTRPDNLGIFILSCSDRYFGYMELSEATGKGHATDRDGWLLKNDTTTYTFVWGETKLEMGEGVCTEDLAGVGMRSCKGLGWQGCIIIQGCIVFKILAPAPILILILFHAHVGLSVFLMKKIENLRRRSA